MVKPPSQANPPNKEDIQMFVCPTPPKLPFVGSPLSNSPPGNIWVFLKIGPSSFGIQRAALQETTQTPTPFGWTALFDPPLAPNEVHSDLAESYHGQKISTADTSAASVTSEGQKESSRLPSRVASRRVEPLTLRLSGFGQGSKAQAYPQ